MDFNGINGVTNGTGIVGAAGGAYGLADVPLGFGFGLAGNERALGAYANLTETEKEHLIMKCKDAKSKEEMQHIVDSLVTDMDATGIREEEKAL